MNAITRAQPKGMAELVKTGVYDFPSQTPAANKDGPLCVLSRSVSTLPLHINFAGIKRRYSWHLSVPPGPPLLGGTLALDLAVELDSGTYLCRRRLSGRACARDLGQLHGAVIAATPADDLGALPLVLGLGDELISKGGAGCGGRGGGHEESRVATHRYGRRDGRRRGGAGRGRGYGRLVGAGGPGNGELGRLGEDDVDVGAVDGVAGRGRAVRGVNVAGDLDRGLAGGGIDAEGDGGVVRGPVDKVDQVDAEVLGVGIDRGPLQIKGGTAGQGRVDSRVRELDGRRQGRGQSEQRQELHHDGGRIIIGLFSVQKNVGWALRIRPDRSAYSKNDLDVYPPIKTLSKPIQYGAETPPKNMYGMGPEFALVD
ncbi:hypothetical protein FJTKL_09097 [Diaporthe vaccinii]|uniref:Uncharacterized protein n=1 Tax=Diaporthe vaccinii TaxID=105482 RepID=A0ABR4ENT8_9PEZI